MLTTEHLLEGTIARMREAQQAGMLTKERDGVPRIVQHVVYSYASKLFVARLFNGKYAVLDDGVVQGLGLFSRPGIEHFADLEPVLERLVLGHKLYLRD